MLYESMVIFYIIIELLQKRLVLVDPNDVLGAGRLIKKVERLHVVHPQTVHRVVQEVVLPVLVDRVLRQAVHPVLVHLGAVVDQRRGLELSLQQRTKGTQLNYSLVILLLTYVVL